LSSNIFGVAAIGKRRHCEFKFEVVGRALFSDSAFGAHLRLQAQVLLYVPGQGIIDFAMARYGLFLSGGRIVVNVVASAVS